MHLRTIYLRDKREECIPRDICYNHHGSFHPIIIGRFLPNIHSSHCFPANKFSPPLTFFSPDSHRDILIPAPEGESWLVKCTIIILYPLPTHLPKDDCGIQFQWKKCKQTSSRATSRKPFDFLTKTKLEVPKLESPFTHLSSFYLVHRIYAWRYSSHIAIRRWQML